MKIAAVSIAVGTLTSFLVSCKKSNNSPEAPSADYMLDLTSSSNAILLNNDGSLINNHLIVLNNNCSYIALSDICTHQGCSINYNSSSKQLHCLCHGGTLYLSGSVISGLPLQL